MTSLHFLRFLDTLERVTGRHSLAEAVRKGISACDQEVDSMLKKAVHAEMDLRGTTILEPDALCELGELEHDIENGNAHMCRSEHGILVYTKETGRIDILLLFVDPSARGQGEGSKLLRQVIDTAGDVPVYLSVSSNNNAAIRLYKSLGFTEITQVRGNGFTTIIMRH